MNELQTDPPAKEQAAEEDVTWEFDFTAALSGATPTLPGSKLTNLATGQTVTLTDSPTVSDNFVLQRVRPGLVAGETYRLELWCTPQGSTNVLEAALQLDCPW